MEKLQTLIVTMNQSDFSKVTEMNVLTDAVFANQAGKNEYTKTVIDNRNIEMITTSTLGVGKNRNIAFMYATGDILLLSDDDLIYVDDYEKIVLNAFEEIKDADAIIFNIETIGNSVNRRNNAKIGRVSFINAFNYGAVRIAVRRKSLQKNGIAFSEVFGGGTTYSAGEDTLFIKDMLKKRLRVYTYPKCIATVKQFESSWFNGFTKKYFYDKGALFSALSPRLFFFLCVQDVLRHKSQYAESSLTMTNIISLEQRGRKGFKQLLPYSDEDA